MRDVRTERAGDSAEGGGKGPPRRYAALYAAVLGFITLTAAAWFSWRYVPPPAPWEPTSARSPWQWLTEPLEWNAFQRMPSVHTRLNGVFAALGGAHLWVVGDDGLILKSTDSGQTWELKSR